jgi:hypothetical protein
VIALVSLYFTEETYGKELNYIEEHVEAAPLP